MACEYSLDLNPNVHAWDGFFADVLNKELALFEPCKNLRLPWEGTGAIFPPGLSDSLIDNMNKKRKMCISVRRRLSSYWGTHISVSFWQGDPFFEAVWKCSKRHIFSFLIFQCGDTWTILRNKFTLPLLNVYLDSFLQLMSI